ncbi:hypothetical protein ASG52_15865 [Methylobacterium sp. Leaf456]|uniref:hypothetical protein n=1 Tax=Methylobacterium sp. Leaf456 TaxID=1736382 RepID=UPI000701C43D|nr:hypothetical protein [Methylobacterium sp. Leaf456]KQT45620.1 hypothetical protein ASG52_15865 [Methylobacterium sp. Leaf456]
MKVAAAYFREKAKLFQQLADTFIGQHDQIANQLRAIADEFEANASALETRIVREAAHLSRDEDGPQFH